VQKKKDIKFERYYETWNNICERVYYYYYKYWCDEIGMFCIICAKISHAERINMRDRTKYIIVLKSQMWLQFFSVCYVIYMTTYNFNN